MPDDEGLTHGEAALYDRQLRLWGVDAQKRLKNSRVIIVGATPLTGEVAKNLILAGVNRVMIIEHEDVDQNDVSSSFFTSENLLGKNRAEAYCGNLKVLNSLVTTEAYNWKGNSMIEFFQANESAKPNLSKNDYVILSGFDILQSAAMAEECRVNGASCYITGIVGPVGFFFCDLGNDFKYCQSDDAQLSNFQRSNIGSEVAIDFPHLGTVLRLNPSLKRMDQVATETVSGQRHFALACNLLNHVNDPEKYPVDHSVLNLCGISLEPMDEFSLIPATASVVGGILAQEMVKAICKNAAPFNNFFFFDATRFYSLVDRVSDIVVTKPNVVPEATAVALSP